MFYMNNIHTSVFENNYQGNEVFLEYKAPTRKVVSTVSAISSPMFQRLRVRLFHKKLHALMSTKKCLSTQ